VFSGFVYHLSSDDRSIELFRTRLETATQMQEVLSKEYKPNCLLIDEIDGAPAVSLFGRTEGIL
jgi:chromosome transmission fidelity protein 18